MDSQSFIQKHLAPIAGKRLLDIGCGKGGLAKVLSEAGAIVTGVDPAGSALAVAKNVAPKVMFEQAGAEALPFADASFDAAIFSNSLHHVPSAAMRAGMIEAGRVVKPGGLVIVVEPLIDGSFNRVLKLINDETDVRTQAQHVLRDLSSDARFAVVESQTYVFREAYADFDAFVVRATSADPARKDVVARKRAEIEAAFGEHAERDANGRFWMDHPLKGDVFRKM